MKRSSRCTNPFLSNEGDDGVDFWSKPQLETSIFGSSYAADVPFDLFEETDRFYADNNTVECDMPELIVCYKESDIHIKDICIHEEMPGDETMSIRKDNDHEFLSKSVLVIDEEDDDDMIETNLDDTEFLKHEWLRPYEREIEASVSFHFDTKKAGDPERETEPSRQQDTAVPKHETRCVVGEASFSMAGVISEIISCSRPIAFSGGMSARSDGSATSTRSFAFPT